MPDHLERQRRAVDRDLVVGGGPAFTVSGRHAELLAAAALSMGETPEWLLEQIISSFLVRRGFARPGQGNRSQPRPIVPER